MKQINEQYYDKLFYDILTLLLAPFKSESQ